MSTISVRLPDSLHEEARELAAKEHVSINQLITHVLAERVAARKAADHFTRRASKASRKRFERVMAKVPDVEPDLEDRL
jgi:hypothetical protein